MRDPVVHLRTTTPPPTEHMDDDDDLAGRSLDELLRSGLEVLKAFLQLAQDISKSVGPPKHASGVNDGRGLPQLEIGGQMSDDDLASLVERLIGRPQLINVLQRHRPPSIPPPTRAARKKDQHRRNQHWRAP